MLVRKSLTHGKKTSACLKKFLRNYALSWDLPFRKTKDFEIQFPCRNKWPQHCITLQMKVGCERWQILLVSRNRQFRKLPDVYYFYFRKIFPCINKSNVTISQTENHTELACLLKTNGNAKCYVTLYAEICFHCIGWFLQRKNLYPI